MMTQNQLAAFNLVCADAVKASDTFDSAIEFEPYFVAVLKFINEHPWLTVQFKEKFLSMVCDPGSNSFELLAFCMYELRWNEIKNAAIDAVKNSEDFRQKSVLAKIINAYSDDWYDKVLYTYYSQ